MVSLLESLRTQTTVVADTGDFESMRRYLPTDATTNPSLILKAVQQEAYRPMLERCVKANCLSRLGKKSLILSLAGYQPRWMRVCLLTRLPPLGGLAN
jgi:transaldolase